jgi:hypothetical protein
MNVDAKRGKQRDIRREAIFERLEEGAAGRKFGFAILDVGLAAA